MQNKISEIRPTSTFDSFIAQNEEQEAIKNWLSNLTEQIAQKLKKSTHWFDHAKVVNLWWWPWRWKSHLLEACAHKLIDSWLWEDVFLYRGAMYTHDWEELSDLKERILLIDDLFSKSKDISDINKYWPLPSYADLMFWAYEKRKLVLTSSNFSTEWIIMRIEKELDPVWRITSRMKEIWQASLELKWNDYREIITSKKNWKDLFSL